MQFLCSCLKPVPSSRPAHVLARHAQGGRNRRGHECARQPGEQLPAALERCAQSGAARHPAQSSDRPSVARSTAMGVDSILVQGPDRRAQADQCEGRDGRAAADLSRSIPEETLPPSSGVGSIARHSVVLSSRRSATKTRELRNLRRARRGTSSISARTPTRSVLLAAQEACQPYYRKLHLSMAASWLSLVRQDEAIDNLLASWDLVPDPQTFVSGNRL
jgi:hypothetical protein